jgi:hypothetical protein
VTEIQWLEQIYNGLGATHSLLSSWTALFQQIAFCAHVVAFAVCWIAGCQSLKYFLYVKNHKDIW